MDDPPYLNAYEAVRKQQISHKNAIRSIFFNMKTTSTNMVCFT